MWEVTPSLEVWWSWRMFALGWDLSPGCSRFYLPFTEIRWWR